MAPLYQFLYVSSLADDAHPACVADIVRVARAHNGLHEITGVLIFDGGRFCQYLEGPKAEVLVLSQRIKVDKRHKNFTIKHEGALTAERRFSGWSMAYALDESGETLEQFLAVEGNESIVLLEQRMPLLDGEFSLRP